MDGPRNKQNNKANSIFYYCRRRSGEWRPAAAARMPARSRFHAGLRRCTCARRPSTPTANSQRGAPRSRVWTPVWTVRAINKIIKLIQYLTIVVGGAGSGVLRLRLVTAGSGGPGHRPSSLKKQRFSGFSRREPRSRPGAITSSRTSPDRTPPHGYELPKTSGHACAPDSCVNSAYLRGRRCEALARAAGLITVWMEVRVLPDPPRSLSNLQISRRRPRRSQLAGSCGCLSVSAETFSGVKAILGGLSLGRGIPFPRCRSILDEDWCGCDGYHTERPSIWR